MSKRWITIVAIILFFVVVFFAGLLFFYSRMPVSEAEVTAPSKPLINKPFPHSQLLDIHRAQVDEQILRKGKVVVVFVTLECNACLTEAEFIQTLLSRRSDVTFYGIIPFKRPPDAQPTGAQETLEKKFPFTVFYDDSNAFVSEMGINRVPVKVYLEDGIIKKGWLGAAMTDQAKASFVEWLDNLP
jgi:hypothetical protein